MGPERHGGRWVLRGMGIEMGPEKQGEVGLEKGEMGPERHGGDGS